MQVLIWDVEAQPSCHAVGAAEPCPDLVCYCYQFILNIIHIIKQFHSEVLFFSLTSSHEYNDSFFNCYFVFPTDYSLAGYLLADTDRAPTECSICSCHMCHQTPCSFWRLQKTHLIISFFTYNLFIQGYKLYLALSFLLFKGAPFLWCSSPVCLKNLHLTYLAFHIQLYWPIKRVLI